MSIHKQGDNVEMKIASASVGVALFVYIFLRTLTNRTSQLREKRLKSEKLKKSKAIVAEQERAMENIERKLTARLNGESDINIWYQKDDN